MLGFIRKIKVIKRFNRILLVLLRAGFGAYLYQVGLKRHIPYTRRFSGAAKAQKSELPIKFRQALETLGPVFVKFGQILSTRSDLLPKEYLVELEKLQAHVPPFSYQEALSVIEDNFQQPVEAVFKEFETQPFASASLGQVYKARLKYGELVAVKVQRPGAKQQIQLDTEVLLMLAHVLEKHSPAIKEFNLLGMVQEFRRWTLNEIDYRKEATNCEIFSDFFRDDPHIYGPKVYWEYSGPSVLTLEFVEGVSLGEVINHRAKPALGRKQIAHFIADSFVKQCFEYGFFHADPHPGNIFIIKNKHIMFLDFGMVGFLDSKLTGIAANIFVALMQKDVESVVNFLLQIEEDYDETLGERAVEQAVKVNALRRQMTELILQWPVQGQAGNYTQLFSQMLDSAVKSGVRVPVDLLMLGKTVTTLDVVMKELDPEFRLEAWEKPLLEQIILKRLQGKEVKSQLTKQALVVEELMKKLPESTAKIVKNLEGRRLGGELNVQQLLEYERLLNANTRLNSSGVLIAAMIVAAALLYKVENQPRVFGWTLAQLGLIFGFGLVIILLLSNFKKGE
jgi:ubiquinone biosynthesis protein